MSYQIFDETSLGKFIEVTENKVKFIAPTKMSELTNDSGFTKKWTGTPDEYDALTSHDADTIYTLIIESPSVTVGTYTYNGKAQGPTISNLDKISDYVVVTNQTNIDAGTYTMTVTLKSSSSMVWSDSTNAAKTYEYTINKATGTLTLSATSVTLDKSTTSTTVTASNYHGRLSASTSAPSIVTASVSGTTITISSVNSTDGSAKITVTSAATKNYMEAIATISVTAKFLKIVTWASGTDDEIAKMVAAADAGKINLGDYWKVGDTRKVNLAAMSATGVGESHDAQQVEMVLMNKGGKTLSNGKTCSFIVGLKDCLKEVGYMNSLNTNAGSWRDSKRRAWCNGTFRNAIPSTLRGVFKQHTNTTGDQANKSTLIDTIDYFALPAEKEIFGDGYGYAGEGYSVDAEANSSKLTQFDWYKTRANRIKKVNGSASIWWERSPYYNYSNYFCFVGSDGTANSYDASFSIGLAPFGCI